LPDGALSCAKLGRTIGDRVGEAELVGVGVGETDGGAEVGDAPAFG
jgi:hypothetical protein